MSEELRTEELLTNEGHTETMADYEDHFDDANPWNRVLEYMEKKTILPVKIEGIVNGGAIAMVEGLRGFIPASKLSLSYIEDLRKRNRLQEKGGRPFIRKADQQSVCFEGHCSETAFSGDYL